MQETYSKGDMDVSMKDEIYFRVDGEIVGKGRPRVTTWGGHARAYTPKRTIDCENRIKSAYLEEYPLGLHWQDKEPLQMVVNIYRDIPKSTPKKLRNEMLLGYVRPVVKPDADNLLKTIADALNGVCYSDDSQIVEVTLNKWYAEEPKAEILIREVSK